MARKPGIFLVIIMVWSLALPASAIEALQPASQVMTLDACLKSGYVNSQELKLAEKNVTVAEESRVQASGGLLPTLGYALDYNKTSSADNIYGGKLSVSWPLYDGGKLRSGVKIAILNLANVKEDERAARQELTYNIKSAFYSLWLAKHQLQVARDSYANSREHFLQMEKLYKAGKKSKFEMLQAQVQWQEQEPKVIAAENNASQAKLDLVTYIGIEKDVEFEIGEEGTTLQVPLPLTITLGPLLDEACQKRPEMRQLAQNIEIAKLNKVIAQAGAKPDLTLSSNYTGTGTDASSTEWDKTWALTLNLGGTLFDGCATASKIRQAGQKVEIARMNETKSRDNLRKNIQKAIQELKKDQASIKAEQANIDLAKEALRLNEIRFAAGMVTSIEIHDSRLSLDEALNGYYQGIASYYTALANLDYIVGRDIYTEKRG